MQPVLHTKCKGSSGVSGKDSEDHWEPIEITKLEYPFAWVDMWIRMTTSCLPMRHCS